MRLSLTAARLRSGLGIATVMLCFGCTDTRPPTMQEVTQCATTYNTCNSNALEECKKTRSEGDTDTTVSNYSTCVGGMQDACFESFSSCLAPAASRGDSPAG
jgi:hypothetical protein